MKDFDRWNDLKKSVEINDTEQIYKKGNIWWCSLGLNIGHEEDGKHENYERPVLVIRKFSKHSCLCLPLSTKPKENPFYMKLNSAKQESYAMISQIRLISTKRFLRKLGEISHSDLRIVLKAIHSMIG